MFTRIRFFLIHTVIFISVKIICIAWFLAEIRLPWRCMPCNSCRATKKRPGKLPRRISKYNTDVIVVKIKNYLDVFWNMLGAILVGSQTKKKVIFYKNQENLPRRISKYGEVIFLENRKTSIFAHFWVNFDRTYNKNTAFMDFQKNYLAVFQNTPR